MNHFISAACLSFDSVDGWNSASIHFFAAASSARAPRLSVRAAAASATAVMRNVVVIFVSMFSCCFPKLLRAAAGKVRHRPLLDSSCRPWGTGGVSPF